MSLGGQIYAFQFGKHLKVDLLSPGLCVCSAGVDSVKRFPRGFVPICSPASRVPFAPRAVTTSLSCQPFWRGCGTSF